MWTKKVIALTLTFAAWTAAAESVVVGIAPVHSLAQAVMGNTGKAELIIPPDQSPHSVRLRPSQARLLQNAKLLFYISEEFERFMPAALRSLPPSVRAVSVLKGIDLLPYRDEDGDDHEKHETKTTTTTATANTIYTHGLTPTAQKKLWMSSPASCRLSTPTIRKHTKPTPAACTKN